MVTDAEWNNRALKKLPKVPKDTHFDTSGRSLEKANIKSQVNSEKRPLNAIVAQHASQSSTLTGPRAQPAPRTEHQQVVSKKQFGGQ